MQLEKMARKTLNLVNIIFAYFLSCISIFLFFYSHMKKNLCNEYLEIATLTNIVITFEKCSRNVVFTFLLFYFIMRRFLTVLEECCLVAQLIFQYLSLKWD